MIRRGCRCARCSRRRQLADIAFAVVIVAAFFGLGLWAVVDLTVQ